MRNPLDDMPTITKPQLTRRDWDAIRDALEMRYKEAAKLAAETHSVHSGIARTFKDIAERADETLTKLEEMGLV